MHFEKLLKILINKQWKNILKFIICMRSFRMNNFFVYLVIRLDGSKINKKRYDIVAKAW